MSMVPLLLSDPWGPLRSSRILNQHFGLGLTSDDLLSPLTYPIPSRYGRTSYYRPWCSAAATGDAGSFIKADKNKYEVNLDVQQFSPNEITIKVSGNNIITVEGQHEEKQDEHGFISRHFLRRYVLPDGHDVNNIISSLSSDGVLTITAPHLGQSIEQQRNIPIQQTGAPLKPSIYGKKVETDPCQRVCSKKDQGTCPGNDEADVCPQKD